MPIQQKLYCDDVLLSDDDKLLEEYNISKGKTLVCKISDFEEIPAEAFGV